MPPGTGVIKLALFFASSNSTSPTTLVGSIPGMPLLTPTSSTIAPFLIHLPFMSYLSPAAAIMTSAFKICCLISPVSFTQVVIYAGDNLLNSYSRGYPTSLPLPINTTCLSLRQI